MDDVNTVRRLPETVVNRIAAGEVIQRPANALKELIENSLDAKSTSLQIVVKSGGLKYIQIQDNGTGIRRENLDIVCERFTTSKLREYEDLTKIDTYGFRGEALASISHIAHLTIQTKISTEKCAYKASYQDGFLKGSIIPCAGNQGTQITVEDLFYNVVTRKKALRSANEEYQKIFEVVGSYAIHNANVGFGLKKYGENTDLRTPAKSSHIENIRIVYGNPIAKELMEISLEDKTFKFKLHGYITNVNYSTKKGILLLFINHRLVESIGIKKALDLVYSTYLPKNGHSFVYMSLQLDPQNVDVNVHPTKHEVHFLYEEQIIEKIKSLVEEKLLSCNNSRVFYIQSRLPGSNIPEDVGFDDKSNKNDTKVLDPKTLVRTDGSSQKLEKFFGLVSNTSKMSVGESLDVSATVNTSKAEVESQDLGIESDEDVANPKASTSYNQCANVNSSNISFVDPKQSFKTREFVNKRNETNLTSIKTLRMEVEDKCSTNLREILANLVFVGCIDATKALIQHSTKLYLCDSTKLMEELFYEILLYDFQNFGYIKFTSALSVYDLALLALDLPECGWSEEDGSKSELAEQVKILLINKGPMLYEYFSMKIDAAGNIHSLPLLLENHTPYMGALPMYLLRLATDVDWDKEKECFRSFCRETAIFYSQQLKSDDENVTKAQNWTQEHVIYAAIRKYFLPPKIFSDNGAILQVANLPDLYKVFERC